MSKLSAKVFFFFKVNYSFNSSLNSDYSSEISKHLSFYAKCCRMSLCNTWVWDHSREL